jgi:hypothetical protein
MAEFNPSESRQTNGGQAQVPVQTVEKPTSVTVFGILNIVFGGLGFLCTPIGIFGIVMTGKTMEIVAGYKIFLLVSSFIGIGFSAWLLTLGIGLVTMKRWARRGSCIYAWIAIVWGIAGLILNILAVSLGWMVSPQGQLPGLLGGMCCGGISGLIYPVLLLIFMQTAKVKQAFQL